MDSREPKILMAEDNQVNRKLAELLFKQKPGQLYLAENGAEAVEKARSMPFDLIFMDIEMPVMNGLEAAKILRAELKPCPPIVALTAHLLDWSKTEMAEKGIDHLLSKPLKGEELDHLYALLLPQL